MGFIKHFNDDMPCTIPDNPNLYFAEKPEDLGKEIYYKGKKVLMQILSNIIVY